MHILLPMIGIILGAIFGTISGYLLKMQCAQLTSMKRSRFTVILGSISRLAVCVIGLIAMQQYGIIQASLWLTAYVVAFLLTTLYKQSSHHA